MPLIFNPAPVVATIMLNKKLREQAEKEKEEVKKTTQQIRLGGEK